MQFDINELLGRTGLYDPTLPTREINLDADSHGNGNASGIGEGQSACRRSSMNTEALTYTRINALLVPIKISKVWLSICDGL